LGAIDALNKIVVTLPSGTLLTIITIGTAIYFYANSLNKIIVDKDWS
jgi:hypothetical protein